MAAVYDTQVSNAIIDYDKSLRNYPISAQRRKYKVNQLRKFLQSLSQNPLSCPVCDKKKLGQLFSNGYPSFTNLRQTHYEDESGTQWGISFFQISKNKVKIYRLIQSQFIDENKRLSQKEVVRLTESDLRQIITESITEILSEI